MAISERVCVLLVVAASIGELGIAQETTSRENSSTYVVVLIPNRGYVTWFEARDAARDMYLNGVRGHLVSIKNAAENTRVKNEVDAAVKANSKIFPKLRAHQFWLGGFQFDSSHEKEPDKGWDWVTNEKSGFETYTNWTPKDKSPTKTQEPNNSFGGSPWPTGEPGRPKHKSPEEAIHFGTGDYWNDLPANVLLRGFVVEFDAQINKKRRSELDQLIEAANFPPQGLGGSGIWGSDLISVIVVMEQLRLPKHHPVLGGFKVNRGDIETVIALAQARSVNA